MSFSRVLLLSLPLATLAAPAGDRVQQLPDFNATSFEVYSGMLDVPGPVAGFDALKIHYQFHASQGDPATDPLVLWHTGGPGGSSIDVGLYTEMGFFQLDSNGAHTNPFAWNRVANMLYLEAPAGSGRASGFSMCYQGSQVVDCSWDDVSQAEAYAHTIRAFLTAFPEYAPNDLYLIGESYFGQYGPNIAHYILHTAPFNETLNLKGMALGNACWGGNETYVQCNGFNADQNDADMFYGKDLISKKLYDEVYTTCNFSTPLQPDGSGATSGACRSVLDKMSAAVGPHNIYNIYDNCPKTARFLERTGMSMGELVRLARAELGTQENQTTRTVAMTRPSGSASSEEGGYVWSCQGEEAAAAYFQRKDVQTALHLPAPAQSGFSYRRSGPASVTLYPSLIGKLRIMIYNGDADNCVPYQGNAEWVDRLESTGLYSEKNAWHPWYAANTTWMPAGYVTEYAVKDSDLDFSFATVRLAGHMVPTFQPNAALTLVERFLANQPL